MKRRKKSNLIYPYFNNENVDVYINNPLEPVFQDMDSKQFVEALQKEYCAKKIRTIFKRIRKEIFYNPNAIEKLCTITDLEKREFIKQFVDIFTDYIDETLVNKLHEIVLK
jgi:hypothetical protein